MMIITLIVPLYSGKKNTTLTEQFQNRILKS